MVSLQPTVPQQCHRKNRTCTTSGELAHGLLCMVRRCQKLCSSRGSAPGIHSVRGRRRLALPLAQARPGLNQEIKTAFWHLDEQVVETSREVRSHLASDAKMQNPRLIAVRKRKIPQRLSKSKSSSSSNRVLRCTWTDCVFCCACSYFPRRSIIVFSSTSQKDDAGTSIYSRNVQIRDLFGKMPRITSRAPDFLSDFPTDYRLLFQFRTAIRDSWFFRKIPAQFARIDLARR